MASFAQPQLSSARAVNDPILSEEDVLLYLDDVKREFSDRPMVYLAFLAIIESFSLQELDTPGVIEKVLKLFRGHNNLILGFNKFLPDGYKIDLEQLNIQDETTTPTTESELSSLTAEDLVLYEDALLFLDDVKTLCSNLYMGFLDILTSFENQEADIPAVIKEVKKLFRGYNHLILEFNKFLPDGYQITNEALNCRDAQYAWKPKTQQQQQQARRSPFLVPSVASVPVYKFSQNRSPGSFATKARARKWKEDCKRRNQDVVKSAKKA